MKKPRPLLQGLSCLLVGGLFCYAGIMHFRRPGFFMRVMPPYLPLHKEAVLVSGFFEILGGLGMLLPTCLLPLAPGLFKGRLLDLRRSAGIGLIALLAAVFPANIYMATATREFAPIPAWLLYLRLPLQFVFMAWVNWSSRKKGSATAASDD